MPILVRYVLAELMKVFLVALAGMTLFIILIFVTKEALSQGLGPKEIVQLVPFILPEALRFAVPATVLFAACSVYGRMAATNEVVAVKAQGISPVVLLWPGWVLAFLLSLAGVWLNDVAVSWGREGAKWVVINSVEDIAYGALQKQGSYSTKQFSIIVKRVEGRRLIMPTISFNPNGDTPAVTITCQEAELRSDTVENTLTITCKSGTFEIGDDIRMNFPDTIERVIPLADASRKGAGAAGPSDKPLWVIPEEIAQQIVKIHNQEQALALRAGFQMMTGDLEGLTGPQWHADSQGLSGERSYLYRLQTEPHRRWANGFSCLCFVLVGAPLAMRMRNADFLQSFFACFFPIVVLYYPFLMYSVDRAKSGSFPPYSVWLGNVIFAVVGIWLMRRVLRY